MKTYHKIHTLFKRYNDKIVLGTFSRPEFEYLYKLKWYWEEKIDGTNIRIIFDGNEVTFKGRTDKAIIPDHLLEYLNQNYNTNKFKNKLLQVFDKLNFEKDVVILFGEGYGYKIQKAGKFYLPDKEVGFIMFDIAINNLYLSKEAVDDIATKLEIRRTPFVAIADIPTMINYVKEGFNSLLSYVDYIAEGVVGIPLVPLNTRNNERIITKIKYVDFKHLRNETA